MRSMYESLNKHNLLLKFLFFLNFSLTLPIKLKEYLLKKPVDVESFGDFYIALNFVSYFSRYNLTSQSLILNS